MNKSSTMLHSQSTFFTDSKLKYQQVMPQREKEALPTTLNYSHQIALLFGDSILDTLTFSEKHCPTVP